MECSCHKERIKKPCVINPGLYFQTLAEPGHFNKNTSKSHLFWRDSENYGFRGISNTKEDLFAGCLDLTQAAHIYLNQSCAFQALGWHPGWGAPLTLRGWHDGLGGFNLALIGSRNLKSESLSVLHSLSLWSGDTTSESWAAISYLGDAIRREPQQPLNEVPRTWHKYLWWYNGEGALKLLPWALLASFPHWQL